MRRGPLELLGHVAGILEQARIPYALGGSLASSIFGEPRSTVDVDIALQISPQAMDTLLGILTAEFYVPSEAAREAVAEHSSFNIVDTASGLKVDLFVLGGGDLDRLQIERRVQTAVPGLDQMIWVTAPEVQVLRKLDWYIKGGEASDRQWRDVVSILRVSQTLDNDFLTDTARKLGLGRHLDGARREAGR